MHKGLRLVDLNNYLNIAYGLKIVYPVGKKTSTRCLKDVLLRQARILPRHLADVQKMS